MKKFLKKQREKLKQFYYRYLLKGDDFSIISNNCWGTRTYQKYGLQYKSPFQSLFIFAPDYIKLIENFSVDRLKIVNFIEKEDSKYYNEINSGELKELTYPIGILEDGCEVHFQHYKSEAYAKEKWDTRVKRINPEKLLFKFSDGYLATDALIAQFDNLEHKNKICFTAKEYPELKSVVYMNRFQKEKSVSLEWKYDKYYISIHKFINENLY
ncbi:capsular polysaccharide biosynthesis protein, putative [hydrothermal vent metagenome]|uniref:Capsular polysaccharide biosynthesis protein, putative n=1 Tax=hydrothermal vent metagenome TaxID=652676 RepID=A0A1W1CNV8_9ZZZZ